MALRAGALRVGVRAVLRSSAARKAPAGNRRDRLVEHDRAVAENRVGADDRAVADGLLRGACGWGAGARDRPAATEHRLKDGLGGLVVLRRRRLQRGDALG